MQTYTVKSGDTLYGISNQFGVSVTDLMRQNNISNASTLKVGQVLTIPKTLGTNPNTTFLYTVVSGDSLYGIARKYNTTVNELIRLNNLKSNSLSIGQTLKIPEMYTKEEDINLPQFINYTVKKGDNLYSIARVYGITPDLIIKDNSLSNTNLSVGQTLRIRVLKDTGVVEECFGEDYTIPSTNTNYINYTVKKGDSLYKIANAYNTSLSSIQNLNNLKSNNLSIGQVLKIPSSSSGGTTNQTYTVKKGDSLYQIAKKFNTTVDSIKNKNKLISNTLSIGQKLII